MATNNEITSTNNQQVELDDSKTSNKEHNFAQLRKSKEQAEYERDSERQARQRLETEIASLKNSKPAIPEGEDDDFDDSEPYIDKKALKKHLSKMEKRNDEKINQRAEEISRKAIEDERRRNQDFRLKAEYPDFNEILTEDNAQKLLEKKPELAQKILRIPDEQLRKEMAYQAIKDLNIHKKEEVKTNVQDRIAQNQRSPYYMPSNVGTPPSAASDFTEQGKKAAYAKMQDLLKNRRAG